MTRRCWRSKLAWIGLVTTVLLGGKALADKAPKLQSGELRIVAPDGEAAGACPLERTDVKADIAGFIARTTVRQEFVNVLEEKIEALYVFPLPHDAIFLNILLVH